ncbi:hypothetical protein EZV62_003896 [Acer yangbiense]|uniref:DUF668 domain-containing protein n=1 Tax=Acer yangbiense TaxID=1000413 RepID=A0A5C7IIK2_9ROSI|nr:hypothetical protein EZV62_003896 [Acer yangbiense]
MCLVFHCVGKRQEEEAQGSQNSKLDSSKSNVKWQSFNSSKSNVRAQKDFASFGGHDPITFFAFRSSLADHGFIQFTRCVDIRIMNQLQERKEQGEHQKKEFSLDGKSETSFGHDPITFFAFRSSLANHGFILFTSDVLNVNIQIMNQLLRKIASVEPEKIPQRLGVAGLALHYANIINQIDNIAAKQDYEIEKLNERDCEPFRNMDFVECWVYAILKEQLPEVFIYYDNIPGEQQE